MQVAREVVERAIGEQMDGTPLENPVDNRNPHAVALGRAGGKTQPLPSGLCTTTSAASIRPCALPPPWKRGLLITSGRYSRLDVTRDAQFAANKGTIIGHLWPLKAVQLLCGWVNPESSATPLTGYRKRAVSASVSGAIHFFSFPGCSFQGAFFLSWSPVSSIIYADESGDLGWSFAAPYRSGGSSRYLTIASLCVPSHKKHIPKRVIRDLYTTFHWRSSSEKKWTDMTTNQRAAFATAASQMCTKHPDIHLHGITVKKERVEQHIRRDENKLYNYMIRLSVIDCMALQDAVNFIPDPRSIKVESGNSLHDYLQTELWFTRRVKTILTTTPLASHSCRGLQFADMLAGLVQQRFEDKYFEHMRTCIRQLRLKRLFFG